MPRVRTIREFQDETLLFKSMLPIKAMIGVGLLISTVMPWKVSLALGFAMVGGTLVKAILSRMGLYTDPLTKQVLKRRKMALIKGDFVVFHIGARANRHVDGNYKWMGDAFEMMTQELEDNPDLGCLGVEAYVGKTGTISIQYWKSLDQLNAWARSSSNTHSGAWARLMKMGRETTDYGFWHEAFEVKNGKYDAIYVNMPPLLLGNCRNVELKQISGKMSSAAGRAGNSDGTDYATHLGKPDY